MPGWIIEPITVQDLGKPPFQFHPALEAMRRELSRQLSAEEFHRRYIKLLSTNSRQVAQAPEVNGRGAEAFWIRKGDDPIAGLIVHFYSWPILAPQLCFRATRVGDQNLTLSLCRFGNLLELRVAPRLAAEVSFLWVAPLFRQRGLGNLLFQKGLALFDQCLTPNDLGFIAARGRLGKPVGEAIFKYLLAHEEQANGRSSETGNIHITGIPVSVQQLNRDLGIDCRYFPIHPDSVASTLLAERANMRFVGYFRTTTPIYAKIWQHHFVKR